MRLASGAALSPHFPHGLPVIPRYTPLYPVLDCYAVGLRVTALNCIVSFLFFFFKRLMSPQKNSKLWVTDQSPWQEKFTFWGWRGGTNFVVLYIRGSYTFSRVKYNRFLSTFKVHFRLFQHITTVINYIFIQIHTCSEWFHFFNRTKGLCHMSLDK